MDHGFTLGRPVQLTYCLLVHSVLTSDSETTVYYNQIDDLCRKPPFIAASRLSVSCVCVAELAARSIYARIVGYTLFYFTKQNAEMSAKEDEQAYKVQYHKANNTFIDVLIPHITT